LKKKLLVMFGSAVLAFSITGTASAAGQAQAQAQAVKVQLDGKTVDFGSNLVLSKGKSYVEYASLFKQLGYETEFDSSTRTIKAATEGTEIQVSVGSDVAFVNGKTVASTGEVINLDGRTLVGLRFAALLTSHDVEWLKQDKTISITYAGPSTEEKAAIIDVFNKMLLIEASDDSEAFLGLMSEDNVMDISSWIERSKISKTKTKIEQLALQSYSDTEAVVILIEDTSKVSGGFFPDNLSKTRYTLHKNADGSWGIYSIEVLAQQLTNIPGLFEQKVSIPDADKAAIDKVFADQAQAANERNVDAYLATMVDFSGKDQLKTTITQIFEKTKLKITTENSAIVQYNGSDTAMLLISTLTGSETDGVTTKTRAIILNEAKKIDGKWLLQAAASILYNEQL